MAVDFTAHYLEEARRQMRGQKRMGEGAMVQLGDDEFFLTLDPESNSVAILVKHLAGNMRSRFTDFLMSDEGAQRGNVTPRFILANNKKIVFTTTGNAGWKEQMWPRIEDVTATKG